jgi:rod shape determining protein RodA
MAMMISENRRSKAHLDIILIILIYALAIFGVLAVTIATYPVDPGPEKTLLNYIVNSDSGSKQALFLLISPIILGVIISFRYESYRLLARFFYYISVFLLFLVLVTSQVSGVKAWMNIIWGYTIQPSEFAKLGMILILARILSRETSPMSTWKDFLRIMSIIGLPAIFILLQGEWGSLFVMIFIFAVMLYFGGVKLKVLFGMAAAGVLLVLAIYGVAMASGSDNYRVQRILSFFNPEMYSANEAYQMTQSKIAIGSGGLSGIGMFVNGSMSQLDYVPADWTDFVFSTIGEAFGFIGCGIIMLLYLLIILRMIFLARFTQDRFGQLIIIGVMSMFLFHVFQNVAMTLGLMPIAGIPLPFLSYGGSNMVTNMGGVGLVLNVVKNRSLSAYINTPQLRANKYW